MMAAMTQTITIRELQDHAGELLTKLGAADEIVVSAEGGAPLARIRAATASAPRREIGFWKGQVRASDDFDRPLPENFWLGEDA